MIDIIGTQVLYFMILKLPKPKGFDMEPSEDVKTSNISTFSIVRIRGGMEQEPTDNKSTTVPKLSSSNFMWNGQPSATLMETIIYPLYMGLGSIQDRGSSLLETIKRIDKGGVLATPSRAVCMASGNRALLDNVEESKSRNRRAFCVIMNYTDSRSWHYHFFMKEFNNSAIDVIEYVLANMVLPFSTLQINDRNSYFTFMTMSKLNLPYTQDGYHMFLDKCIKLGDELSKSSTDISIRFVDGLPEIAQQVMCVTMRKEISEGKYIFPATYGAMTTLIGPASWAAKATPDPGNTDYWGLAFAHRDEWNTLIKGVKAQPPKGFARSVTDGDQIYSLSGPSFGASEPAYEWSGTQDLHANLISADTMTWDNECVVCFGKGHPARCQKDGVVITCATLELKTKPQELTPSKSKSKASANEIKDITSANVTQQEVEQIREAQSKNTAVLQAIVRKMKDKKNRSRPSSRASASSIGSLPSDLASDFNDDDDADSMESQHVPHFADEVARK